jgi:hypothetical protein
MIAAWQLPRETLLKVYDRLLVTLPGDPDRYLRDRIAPLAAFAYHFALTNPGPTGARRAFLFAIDRHDERGELHVVGGRHTVS